MCVFVADSQMNEEKCEKIKGVLCNCLRKQLSGVVIEKRKKKKMGNREES